MGERWILSQIPDKWMKQQIPRGMCIQPPMYVMAFVTRLVTVKGKLKRVQSSTQLNCTVLQLPTLHSYSLYENILRGIIASCTKYISDTLNANFRECIILQWLSLGSFVSFTSGAWHPDSGLLYRFLLQEIFFRRSRSRRISSG